MKGLLKIMKMMKKIVNNFPLILSDIVLICRIRESCLLSYYNLFLEIFIETICYKCTTLHHIDYMRIYTGVKPILCRICDRAFLLNGHHLLKEHLILHQRTNTGEKLFSLWSCNLLQSCEQLFQVLYHVFNLCSLIEWAMFIERTP